MVRPNKRKARSTPSGRSAPKRASVPRRASADASRASSPSTIDGRAASVRSAPKRAPSIKLPRCAIVGIGASAGGLAALEQFLKHLPESSGVACVIVTHQHPARTSLLPELLAKNATIPVKAVVHNTRIEPNRAYVVPAGAALTIENNRLLLAPLDDGGPRLPIDHFFRSLARNVHENAIGVVLSGNGADGTLGITAIKGEGGMVMAQEPSTAQYAGMPSSAIATQLVDFVLPPEKMAERIVQYCRGRFERAPVPDTDDESSAEPAFQRVLAILRMRSGNDFAAYKKSTIRRRIERRMAVHNLTDARDYARFLEQAPFEADALFKEVLISVTSFFRDPGSFSAFETALSVLIAAKPDDAPLRGWIAGCATGEEAYSLAIIAREQQQKHDKNLKIQLFATDLDPQAIELARMGRYPEGISADITPERLARYFDEEDGGYRIRKEIRETLVFASQSVIRDPPFTKLDFISCRNLLIYLEPDLQRRVLSLFAYSLATDGLLLLGTSESITGFEDRFITLDKKWKLYKRREHPTARAVLTADMPGPGGRTLLSLRPGTARLGSSVGTFAERLLLTSFTPPSAIISERGEIVYLHGRTGPFLEPAQGEPTSNLFKMAREGLRIELPAAVRQASKQNTAVTRHGLQVKTNGAFSPVSLSVRRILDPEVLRGTYLVSFQLEPGSRTATPKARGGARAQRKEALRIDQLERELLHTRENLQGTIEELETSNEELKSTNEELQSTNEELQSANEELETSREEMQSLNEELQTVNAELEERNRALSQANDDMQNLLNSTDIATVFLDDKLSIKRFTTQAKKVFSLIDTDVGRPISDLATNLRYTALVEDALDVLRTLVFREREIQTGEGLWRLMRIMPYRTHDNLIDGLVLTFVDIDRVKRAQQESQQAREYAEGIVDGVDQPLLVLDSKLHVISANRAFYAAFRTAPKLEIGEPLQSAGAGRWDIPELIEQLRGVVERGSELSGFPFHDEAARAGPQDYVLTGRPLRVHGAEPMLLLSITPASRTKPAQT